jgi:hypothetical protein
MFLKYGNRTSYIFGQYFSVDSPLREIFLGYDREWRISQEGHSIRQNRK